MSQESYLSTPPDSEEVPETQLSDQEVGYLDGISKDDFIPLGTEPYFVTVTYPGGLQTVHMARVHQWLSSGFPDGPAYFCGAVEGDNDTQHKHVHLLIWAPPDRRTDSVSRTVQRKLFTPEDFDDLTSTSRLVLTRKVSDIAGVLRYIYKAASIQHLSAYKLPPGVDFERVLQDVARYHLSRLSELQGTSGDLWPSDGKTRTVPPSKVPDFLIRAAADLQVPVGDFNSFGSLCHRCYRRGIRFDLSKLRSYRLAVEMITQDPDVERSKILQHELEWRSSN